MMGVVVLRRFSFSGVMAAPELLSDEGFRGDGRRPAELRQIRARMGVFSQADGSAYIEQGNTKALAVVYGPHEIRGSRWKALPDRALVNCQYSLTTFSTAERRRRPHGDRGSVELAAMLKETFEATILTRLFPRSQIDIYVQVLQADGGNYCAGVNAASLAVMDAGIPVRDLVCASSAGLAEDIPLADLSGSEEASGAPKVLVALLPAAGTMALLQLSARLHQERLETALDAATKACRALHAVLESVVRERLREGMALLAE
ncbi:exosome complex component RRP41 [Cuculus canorus]|uniref:exosome complex component RRP41 n=1 Tax=Cuculus canorus TaxID=55661 RepID=UPI0023AA37C2|nr:exosome complex component RRP41 [Cuculus canorus]XP_053913735.1 exosome complex component RRP41 [Cuculus canorus]